MLLGLFPLWVVSPVWWCSLPPPPLGGLLYPPSSVGWCCLVSSFFLGGVVVFSSLVGWCCLVSSLLGWCLLFGGAAFLLILWEGLLFSMSSVGWCCLVSAFWVVLLFFLLLFHHVKGEDVLTLFCNFLQCLIFSFSYFVFFILIFSLFDFLIF